VTPENVSVMDFGNILASWGLVTLGIIRQYLAGYHLRTTVNSLSSWSWELMTDFVPWLRRLIVVNENKKTLPITKNNKF